MLPARALLLPGWVGRPALSALQGPRLERTCFARYAVLQACVATWHEVAYDRAAFETKVRRSGLPEAYQQRILSGY